MDDVAVTQVDGKNFEVLSCFKVAYHVQSGRGRLQQDSIEQLLAPLFYNEGCHLGFIDETEDKAKKFLVRLFKKPDGIVKKDFTYKKKLKFSILCHKRTPWIYSFLVKPLSDERLKAIEKNASGKTYLTGDKADMHKTKKDMH